MPRHCRGSRAGWTCPSIATGTAASTDVEITVVTHDALSSYGKCGERFYRATGHYRGTVDAMLQLARSLSLRRRALTVNHPGGATPCCIQLIASLESETKSTGACRAACRRTALTALGRQIHRRELLLVQVNAVFRGGRLALAALARIVAHDARRMLVAAVWEVALRFVCTPTGTKANTVIKQKAAIPRARVNSTSENAAAADSFFIADKSLRCCQCR